MANWKKTVDIKAILKQYSNDDESQIDVASCARAFAEKIRAELPEYGQYAENFDDIADNEEYAELEEFNYELHELYDWADRNLVWLGLLGA